MRALDLARQAGRNLRHGGPGVVLELASRTYLSLRSVDADPVYDEEWDLLVVLDATRADLWREVAPDAGFPAGETRTSVGGTSTEWLERTFGAAPEEWCAGTGYVTGNPYSDGYLDDERLAVCEEVWRDAWDDDLGTVRARPITDRAILAGRERDPERLVVHYMQPHFPCVPEPSATEGIALEAFGEEPLNVWEELRFGWRDREAVWELYRANLEYVLEEVRALLENYDADRVAITADHGNAMGEAHLYGHVAGVALPAVREVPWATTTATDERTRDPERGAHASESEATVAERLQALGYVEE